MKYAHAVSPASGMSKRLLGFALLGGLLLAFYLSHWWLPVANQIQPVQMPGWITTGVQKDIPSSHKGFFRHALELPFAPTQAWVQLAGPDYELIVNGHRVGRNRYVVNVTVPFTHNVSDSAQSLIRGQAIGMARAPSLQKRANQGWRMVQLYDITRYLRRGRNLIAVSVQSDGLARFAIQGEVLGQGQRQRIPGEADQWKVSLTSDRHQGLEWHALQRDDSGWPTAVYGGPIEEPQYLIQPAELWTRSFEAQAVTGMPLTDGVYFRTELPGLPWWASVTPAYLRVASNWPYRIFVGDRFIAEQQTAQVMVYDLTRFAGSGQPLYIWLQRPAGSGAAGAPWLRADGRIGTHLLDTGPGWQTLTRFDNGWLNGQGEWAGVSTVALEPRSVPIRLFYTGVRDLGWLMQLLGMALVLGMGLWAWLRPRAPAGAAMALTAQAEGAGGRLRLAWLLPPLVAVACVELLRLRFQENDTLLWYLDPDFRWIWLSLPLAVLLLTGWALREPGRMDWGAWLARGWRAIPAGFWLLLIIALGIYLRFYNLQFEDLQADENVSWDASRGILKTGVPEAVSGVLYTRSPLYHYMLAGWLWLFGDNVYVARSLAGIFGIGAVLVFYRLLLEIGGKPYLALLGALLIAVDPWEIQTSRIIRFYQQMQFFSILAALLFLKAFVWQQGKRYQLAFFAAVAAAVLSQEVYITVFPALGIAFLVFYKRFDWARDRHIWISFFLVCLMTVVDIGIFTVVCLTSHVGVATTSASIMQLHLLDVLSFITTLGYGDNGANLIYSLIALAGLFYWRRRPEPAVTFLYLVVVLTLVTLTILVLQVAARYGNSIYPFMIAIALITADRLVAAARQALFGNSGSVRARRWTRLLGGMAIALFVVNLEPWKIMPSYHLARTPEHESALTFVAQRLQPGDKVISVYPMPAAILLGGIDYYLVGSVAFDELYHTPKGVIERWAGGELVSKNDHLRKLFDQHDRVWIIVDEIEGRKMPGSMHELIKNSCRVVMEFFGGTVYLWDKSAGLYHAVPDLGGHSDGY